MDHRDHANADIKIPYLVTRSIVGYKTEESDALLKFLYDHLAFGADFHVRIKWKPRAVVVWDVSFFFLFFLITFSL